MLKNIQINTMKDLKKAVIELGYLNETIKLLPRDNKDESYYVIYQKDDSGTKELKKFPFTDADSSKEARKKAEQVAKSMRSSNTDSKITNPIGLVNPKGITTNESVEGMEDKELDVVGTDNRDTSTTRLDLSNGSYIEVNPVELMGDAVDNTDDPEIIKQFKDFVLNNLY